MFACKRCGYNTRYKRNLIRHLLRKKMCLPILKDVSREKLLQTIDGCLIEHDQSKSIVSTDVDSLSKKKFQCALCKKKFTRKDNLRVHENHYCAYTKTAMGMSELAKELLSLKQKNDELTSKYEKLSEKLSSKQNQILNVSLVQGCPNGSQTNINSNVQNVTQHVTQNVTQNIIINNYGKEHITHLSPSFMTSLLKIPYNSIQKLIQAIHFDPSHPENHNLKIPNRKEKFAVVYNDGKWVYTRKKDLIENMVDKGYTLLDAHFGDNKSSLQETKQQCFKTFQSKYENNSKMKRQIETDVEINILNFQMAHGTEEVSLPDPALAVSLSEALKAE